jgi:hypothetical protein
VHHLRVREPVLSSGPTVVGMLANAAFYFGLTRTFAETDRPVWSQSPYGPAALNRPVRWRGADQVERDKVTPPVAAERPSTRDTGPSRRFR